MRKLIFGAFLSMIFSAFSTAYATGQEPKSWCVREVKQGDFLNLRDRPSLAGSVIGRIPSNTCGLKNKGLCVGRNVGEGAGAEVSEANVPKMHWCPVKWLDKEGWVSLIYLSEEPTP